jgi:hypothetical protein
MWWPLLSDTPIFVNFEFEISNIKPAHGVTLFLKESRRRDWAFPSGLSLYDHKVKEYSAPAPLPTAQVAWAECVIIFRPTAGWGGKL